MNNLDTQETLRDKTWKNGQSRDTVNIKHKRWNVEESINLTGEMSNCRNNFIFSSHALY
jgi:hypothetical protein